MLRSPPIDLPRTSRKIGTHTTITRAKGKPWCAGGDRPSSRGAEWPQTMVGRQGELASRQAIFADGAPAPPVTSFVASKALSRSVNATKAHDMTLAGGASLNSGISLVAAAVDKALKGSMAREEMKKALEEKWGRRR
jgi:hypothetical protein